MAFNRNYLILTKQISARQKGKLEWSQQDFFSFKTYNNDPTMSGVEGAAIGELDVDALNYTLNYVRYFAKDNFSIDPAKPEVRPIEIGKRIHAASTLYANLKEQFDESIWNSGYWQLLEMSEKPLLKLVFADTELLILNRVGLIRFQRNSLL